MILDLSQFESFPARLSVEADPEKIEIDYEGVVRLISARLDLNIQNSGEEFFCQGEANASIRLTCARCLKEFDRELDNSINFIVCSKQWHDDCRGEEDNEEYVFFKGSDLQADVSELMRQAVIMSISLKPLCSEDCKGLCPSCGINLNEKSCQCEKGKVDTRWEALKKISRLT